jgi:hypothetical protein
MVPVLADLGLVHGPRESRTCPPQRYGKVFVHHKGRKGPVSHFESYQASGHFGAATLT